MLTAIVINGNHAMIKVQILYGILQQTGQHKSREIESCLR